MQQEVERTDTTEEHRLQCQTKLNILLEQRKDPLRLLSSYWLISKPGENI